MELNLGAEAVLAWLPKGTYATDKDFSDKSKVEPPPSENPEPWWTLQDAVVHAATIERDHDKVPWIKSGGKVFDQFAIDRVASALFGR